MSLDFIPRPEDFRFAWATAYRLSILQVDEMQRRADDQLKTSADLTKFSADQAEVSRANLQKTGSVLVQQLRQASIDSSTRIVAATNQLVEQSQALFEKEVALRAQTQKLAAQLVNDRRQLEKEKQLLFARPLWRRLWHACKNER